jgi:hypothetical protein
MKVLGGLVLPPQGGGAPAGELDTTDALIAFYADRGEASVALPMIVKNVRRFGGQVERDGEANIAWLAAPARGLREVVGACAGE